MDLCRFERCSTLKLWICAGLNAVVGGRVTHLCYHYHRGGTDSVRIGKEMTHSYCTHAHEAGEGDDTQLSHSRSQVIVSLGIRLTNITIQNKGFDVVIASTRLAVIRLDFSTSTFSCVFFFFLHFFFLHFFSFDVGVEVNGDW